MRGLEPVRPPQGEDAQRRRIQSNSPGRTSYAEAVKPKKRNIDETDAMEEQEPFTGLQMQLFIQQMQQQMAQMNQNIGQQMTQLNQDMAEMKKKEKERGEINWYEATAEDEEMGESAAQDPYGSKSTQVISIDDEIGDDDV